MASSYSHFWTLTWVVSHHHYIWTHNLMYLAFWEKFPFYSSSDILEILCIYLLHCKVLLSLYGGTLCLVFVNLLMDPLLPFRLQCHNCGFFRFGHDNLDIYWICVSPLESLHWFPIIIINCWVDKLLSFRNVHVICIPWNIARSMIT